MRENEIRAEMIFYEELGKDVLGIILSKEDQSVILEELVKSTGKKHEGLSFYAVKQLFGVPVQVGEKTSLILKI